LENLPTSPTRENLSEIHNHLTRLSKVRGILKPLADFAEGIEDKTVTLATDIPPMLPFFQEIGRT
jgi:hypothetical protein